MRTPAPVGTVAAFVACGVAAACGGSPSAPSEPQSVAPAFVYVLTPPPAAHPANVPVLSTLRVTETGDLQLVDRHPIVDARAIATDPRGRVLFVAGGPRPRLISSHFHYQLFPNYLRVLSIDRRTGASTPLSEGTLPGLPPNGEYGYPPRYWQAVKLIASDETVYAIADDEVGDYGVPAYRYDPVTGALTDAPTALCDMDDSLQWLLPLGRYVLMPNTDFSFCPGPNYHHSSLFGVFVEDAALGQLVTVGEATWPDGRVGFVAGAATNVGNCVALTWYGYWSPEQGISIYSVDPATGAPALFRTIAIAKPVAIASSPSGLLATATTTADAAVTVYSVTSSCDLQERFSMPTTPATSLAFHPSGRFLYAMQDGGIRTYALKPDGRFGEMRGFADGLTGTMVLAAPSS